MHTRASQMRSQHATIAATAFGCIAVLLHCSAAAVLLHCSAAAVLLHCIAAAVLLLPCCTRMWNV